MIPFLFYQAMSKILIMKTWVNTYLFYQVCKVYDTVSESSIPMQRSHDTLASDISA